MNEKRAVGYDYKVCSAGLVLILTVLCTASWALDPLPVPPQASVVPHEYWKHGQIIQDNYFWLRQKDNPTVLEYIKAENRYAEDMMKHTGQFQENLFQEMRSRIKETDLSVPEKLDDYYYYSRMEKGKEYAIHCRKKDSLQSEEEILLDENELAAGHDFFSLGVYEVSPNHELLMYSVETSGSEEYTIHFKNLKNPSLVYEETIVNTDTTAEWANDNKIIFYITLDDSHRPYQLHRHTLGTTTELDTMLYEEEAEAYSTFISKTRSKQYLVLAIESNTTSELHILNANTPEKEFKPVHTRKKGVECSIAHHGDRLFILTNDKAVNFRLMEAPVSDFSRYLWKEIIAHRPSVAIEGIDVFSGHLVIYERSDGLRKMRVRNLTNNQEYYIEFPEPVYTFWEGSNYDFNTNVLRFTYSSLITPETVYDYDLDTRERELKKKQEVPEYDPQKYLTEKIFATTDDGTRVPISLVYRKDLTLNGQNPCFMEGYGAYGDSLEPYFFTTCLSLLDRGFVYAIAHVRGGSEMGRLWYKQGKLLRKRNTFTDFIACAKYLIKKKYTSSSKLVIRGESAGGMLMGAVSNMRPDLFDIVIAKVPFVDVLNTMLDATLPLTVAEYEEWGNPNIKYFFNYIQTYSPYDNVTHQDYPNMLVLTSFNDTRVMYWEPAKWVARLRGNKTDRNLLLFKTTMVAGHGGASGRYSYLRDIAFEYAFVFDRLGIKE